MENLSFTESNILMPKTYTERGGGKRDGAPCPISKERV